MTVLSKIPEGARSAATEDKVGSDRGRGAGEGCLRDRVGQVVAHRPELLARGHPDDSTTETSVVSCGEGLGQQQCCSGVDRPVSVVCYGSCIADRYRIASVGVVAHQDVEMSQGLVCRRDELLAGRRVGEVCGQCDHTAGPGSVKVLDQYVDVVGGAVLSDVVGEVVVHREGGAYLGKSPCDREADAALATHPGHKCGSSIQGKVGRHARSLWRYPPAAPPPSFGHATHQP